MWSEYGAPQAAALECAFASGGDSVVQVDAERQVDVRRMRQERIGAPGRSRAVRREPVTGGAGSSSADGASSPAAVSSPNKRARIDAPTPAPTLEEPAWRLNRLGDTWARLVPAEANTSTAGLRDLLSHSELEGATEVHLHNFMVDLDWMA